METRFVYCPNCGQKRIDRKETLGNFIRNFLGDYFAYDSKLMKSLKPLLFKPGFLSLEYLAGKRINYISPLRLYIFISIVFFIILNLSGTSRSSDLDANLWDSFFHDYLPKVFFFLLPLFALILSLLFKKLKRGYVFNLISALHIHSFLFLLLAAYLLLSKLIVVLGFGFLNVYLLILVTLSAAFYILKSLKNTFDLSWPKAIGNFFLLMLIYGGLVSVTLLMIVGFITLQE